MAINLGSALVYLGAELSGLKSGLAQGESETASWAKRVGDSTLKLVGGVIVGGVTAAAAAVGAIGGIALNTASDIDAATKNSMAQLGRSAADAEKLGEAITNVYANNFGDSIDDVGQAITDVTQQMDKFGRMTADELQKATEHAISLRDAFGIEVSESTNAVNTLMENFGLTSDQAFSLVQSGLQNGLNASGDFLDSIGEYSTQFANGGASVSEFFNIMASGLQGGMLGTDKAADLFKEFRLRIQDGSTLTADSLAAIGLSMDDIMSGLNDGSLTVMDAFNMVQRGLGNTEDKTAAFNAAVGLMGSQFEDLGDSVVDAIDPMTNTMEDWIGMTSDINVQYDNMGSFIEGLKRKAEVGLAPLGNLLLEIGNRAMPLINEGFAWLEGKLGVVTGLIQAFFDEAVNGEGVLAGIMNTLRSLGASEELRMLVYQIAQFFNEIINGEGAMAGLMNFLRGMGVAEEARVKIHQLVTAISDFIDKAVEFVGTHSEEFKGALIAIGAVLATLAIASAIAGIGAALATLLSPIGLIVAAIAILGAAWAGNWGGIQEKTTAVIEFISNLITTAMTFIQEFWAANGEQILTTAMTVWTAVQEFIASVWEIIKSLFAAFKAAFEGDWAAFGENLRAAWDQAWELILTVISNLWSLMQPLLQNLWNNLQGWWNGIDWAQLGRDLVDGIMAGIGNLASQLMGKLQEAAQAAQDAWDGFWGNQSPSKWMIRSMKNVIEGAKIGLGDGSDLAGQAATVAAAVARPFTDVLTGSQRPGVAAEFTRPNQTNSKVLNFFGDLIFPNVKDRDSMIEALEALPG